MIAQQAVRDCRFVQLDHPVYSPDLAPRLPVTIFCSVIWSLTFVVSAILTMKRSRKLSRSDWRDRQKNSILVELTVCQKNVANALNSVVIILKNKLQFLTFPSFFMVKLMQNFLNASRIEYNHHAVSRRYNPGIPTIFFSIPAIERRPLTGCLNWIQYFMGLHWYKEYNTAWVYTGIKNTILHGSTLV